MTADGAGAVAGCFAAHGVEPLRFTGGFAGYSCPRGPASNASSAASAAACVGAWASQGAPRPWTAQ